MSLSSPFRPNALLAVSAPLLYLLTGAPPAVRSRILTYIPAKFDRARLITSLICLVAAGIGAQLNSLLNAWARNNWILRWWGQGRSESLGANGWDVEVAVITGGSNGIGALTAQGLASKGIRVAILDIAEPKDNIDGIHYFSCDITSKKAVMEAAQAVKSFLGPPGILINNAGLAHTHTVLDASPEQLRQLFDVNIISQFYTIQAFLPDMIRRKKGHVVTIASMASFFTPAGLVDYSATKAGVLALHEGLHQELKHRYDAPEIKTSVFHPIYVGTGLIDSYREALKRSKSTILSPQTVADAVINQILSGRSGQIFLPPTMSFASAIRSFPWWVQEVVRDTLKDDCKPEEELETL